MPTKHFVFIASGVIWSADLEGAVKKELFSFWTADIEIIMYLAFN